MKKTHWAVVVVVVLALLYTGSSWFLGMRTQSVLESVVERTNHRFVETAKGVSSSLQLRITSYERGVFTSRVHYTLELPKNVGLSGSLQFEDVLHHGPFPWTLVRQGEVSPLLAYSEARMLPTELVQRWFDVADGEPLQARTRFGFTSDGTSVWTVAPVAFDGDPYGKLAFSGGDVVITFSKNATNTEVIGNFATLTYANEDFDMRLRDMALSGTTRVIGKNTKTGVDLMQSDSTFTIANGDFSVSDESGKIENLTISASGKEYVDENDLQLVDAELRYGLGKLEAEEINWGTFSLPFGFKKMDQAAILALSQSLEILGEDAGEDEDALMDAVQTHVHTLLKAQPSFAIAPLRWENEKGASTAALNIDFFFPENNPYFEHDVFSLSSIRQAKLEIAISRAMAIRVISLFVSEGAVPSEEENRLATEIFDQYASRWQEVGLVQIDGDKIGLLANYRGEEESVDLNGRKMSLSEFMGLALQSL